MNSKITSAYKGFDGILNVIRMTWNMLLKMFIIFLIVHLLITSAAIYLIRDSVFDHSDSTDWCMITTYYKTVGILNKITKGSNDILTYTCEGTPIELSYNQFIDRIKPYVEKKINVIKWNLLVVFDWCAIVWLAFPVLLVLFARKHEKDSKDEYIRGSKFVAPEKLKEVLDQKDEWKIQITQNIAIPNSIINRHTFVIGRPGSGKTQLISRMIDQIIKAGYKIIIHDFKGDFISQFYDYRKHLIFNPLDKRHCALKDKEMYLIDCLKNCKCKEFDNKGLELIRSNSTTFDENRTVGECVEYSKLLDIINDLSMCQKEKSVDEKAIEEYEKGIKGWSLFNELSGPVAIDAFVASLIPESASNDNFWPLSARSLLGSIITYCNHQNQKNYDDLWRYVNLSNTELLPLLKATPGCEEGVKLLAEDKTANSIMAVLANYTKPIKYLSGTDGNFSITNWVKDADHPKRVIFLSNYSMVQETIKPFLTLFVDFATKTLCSLPDDLNRRLYVILDEFGQLSKIPSIISLLTQSRSKGGSCALLIQDISQIRTIYGNENASSIVNACGNTFSFAVADESTAETVSKKIGSVELRKMEESASLGMNDMKDSISLNRQTQEKRLVMPSELMALQTLNFYCQLTDCDITKDKLEYISFPCRADSYIDRPITFKLPANVAASTAEGTGLGNMVPQKEILQQNEQVEAESWGALTEADIAAILSRNTQKHKTDAKDNPTVPSQISPNDKTVSKNEEKKENPINKKQNSTTESTNKKRRINTDFK